MIGYIWEILGKSRLLTHRFLYWHKLSYVIVLFIGQPHVRGRCVATWSRARIPQGIVGRAPADHGGDL